MGWDPFDGLNSVAFKNTPLSKSRLARLLWLQFFKRSPINLRNVLRVKKDINPHTLGILLSTMALNKNDKNEYGITPEEVVSKLKNLSSEGWSGRCWGYNFEWQARAFYQPAFSPTVVPTVYVAHGLLDIHDNNKNEDLLNMARSACDFILNDLKKTQNDHGDYSFSYSPLDDTVVYNASLLASSLLARVYSHTGEEKLLVAAEKSADFCVSEQNIDGSWFYGRKAYHQWIDSFHTGYNLECLDRVNRYSKKDYSKAIEEGFAFYIENLFEKKQYARYYTHKRYPIDLNSISQLIIVLQKLNKTGEYGELARKLLLWSVHNMQSKKGYFYYQKRRFMTNKIPYMRWTQIWMLYSLTIYSKFISEQS